MIIKLLDLSHWQPPVDWRKAKAAGIKGVYIKVSQGASYRDPAAAEHYHGATAQGLLTGFYHFVTNDNAAKQFDNFAEAANAIGQTQLAPALDCEAYTSYQMETFCLRELREFTSYYDVIPRSLTYPSSAIIDSIGRKLLKHHPHVAIYTNVASGNRIFGNQDVFGRRYQLWVANWNVSAPALPAAWKGKQYMCWQKGVVEGAEFGVTGKVDYNEWGTSLPWPGNEEPPAPPTPTQKARVILKIDGKFRTFEEIDNG